MIASQLVQAEPLNFSEKGVDEVYKKIIQRFLNVISFYELYATEDLYREDIERPKSENLLDKWIIARLDQVLEKTTSELEAYNLDAAARPFFDFVDDLSTWYLRRSRERVKGEDEGDKQKTLETLSYVIYEFSKAIAPFMPFLAEAVYQKITGFNYKDGEKSVHLLNWSSSKNVDEDILKKMEQVRIVVALSLEARDSAGIKVKQPLKKVSVGIDLENELKQIIADEINVKEVIFDNSLKEKEVKLDTNITEELRQEGNVRELVRFIQAYRKESNLHPNDKIKLRISTKNKALIKNFRDYIRKVTNANSIDFADDKEGKSFEIDNAKFIVRIKK